MKIGEQNDYMMKVGQFPPWEITADPVLERALGEHATNYKKGLTCESQGYGIGAFAYYRRIVESIIDQLLDDIAVLVPPSERAGYDSALAQAKATTVAADKIALVKDLLPPILRPGGVNPLGTLHTDLSEGLHAASDDDCLEIAEQIRNVLTFLVAQVETTKDAGASFTEGMKKLLDRKARKGRSDRDQEA